LRFIVVVTGSPEYVATHAYDPQSSGYTSEMVSLQTPATHGAIM